MFDCFIKENCSIENIDELLSLNKYAEILLTIKDPTPIKRLRCFVLIETLTEILNLDTSPTKWLGRVRAKHKFLKRELKKDPNKVFWDYAEYYNVHKNKTLATGIMKNILVSSKGDLIILTMTGKLYIQLSKNNIIKRKYKRICGTYPGSIYGLHRIIGCTFIAPPPGVINTEGLGYLVTNHLDCNPGNNEFTNLEWCTDRENTIYTITHGNRKVGNKYYEENPLLLEVIAENKFKGRKYVINNIEDCNEVGFRIPGMIGVKNNQRDSYYGHSVSRITKEESKKYHIGVPSDIKELLIKKPKYFSIGQVPYVGKIIDGPFKDLEFSIIGEIDSKFKFIRANIYKVVHGYRKTHMNCTWRICGLDEYLEKSDVLNEEIYKSIR